MADAIFLNRKLTEANAWVRNFGQASIRHKKAYESGNRADAVVNYNLMQSMAPQLEQIEDDVALYFDPNYKRAKQTTSDEEKTELKLPSPLLLPGSPGRRRPRRPVAQLRPIRIRIPVRECQASKTEPA